MADDLTALEQHLKKDGAAPAYIVQGEERLLVDAAVKAIVAAAVDNPADPMQVTRVDLAESGTGGRDIVGATRSMGLFATRQAVIVRATDVLNKKKAERAMVEDYLNQPSPGTTLIMIGRKIDGKTALSKRTKKVGKVLSFAGLKPWKVPDWLMGEARRIGHRLDNGTARLIADLSGSDLQKLRLVLDQLSLFVGPGQPITSQAAESMLAATRSHTVFELVDSVAARNTVQALQHVHAMLSQREPALRILSMLTRHYRQLRQVGELRAEGASMNDVQSAPGIHSYPAKKLYEQSHRVDPPQLRRAYDELYRADMQLKGSGLDDALVMERLVMSLCR